MCLIHCNCFCIYNVKSLCIVKVLFRVGMHVPPYIFKIRYMLFLKKKCCVSLSTFDYYFFLICMGCRNSDKAYVANSTQFLTSYVYMHCCYYNTNIVYNIMNNVQISVAKRDISLHGICGGHSPFSY